jgi:hypothetical protein
MNMKSIMNLFPFPIGRSHPVRLVALWLLLMSLGRIHAAPTIVSTFPPSGATNVSPAASVVISFSEPMNISVMMIYFFALPTYEALPTSLAWSAGNTVLTCTPNPAFPTNQKILWTIMNGQNPAGQPLTGYTGGDFTTASEIQPRLVNPLWTGGTFSFDVTSQAGQTLTIEYSSTLRPNQWQTLLTTNNPPGQVHIVDPHSTTNRYLFYRARSGS